MKKMMVTLVLAGLTWGLVGCGGASTEPPKDAQGKVQAPPGVPPGGP